MGDLDLNRLAAEIASAQKVSERYEDVLASITRRESPLPSADVFDAEIERVADRIEPYLAAYREWLEAESLFRVLNELPSPLAGTSLDERAQEAFREQLAARRDVTRAERDQLREQHAPDVDRLRVLLELRDRVSVERS